MSAPEYRIESVHDFLKVPSARRGECLREFRRFLDMHADIQTIAGVELQTVTFTFVDDGKHETTINLVSL